MNGVVLLLRQVCVRWQVRYCIQFREVKDAVWFWTHESQQGYELSLSPL